MVADLDEVRRALEDYLGAWLEQLMLRAAVENGFAPAHVYMTAEFQSREEVRYKVRLGAPMEWGAFEALLEAARAAGIHPVSLDPTERGLDVLMVGPLPVDVRRLARL